MKNKTEKVAITATEESVNGEMDQHFGRCPYFIISDGERNYAVKNTARDATGGAGIKAAQLMIDHSVEVVITGSLGPKASQALNDAGIRSYVGASGNIEDVIKQYREGQLK
ncbi:MAG: dinitrogenase iron-molybdenum cofactor biosynthesis protein [Euryarchaeota archaeon]|nr:dinitrogenase iron-molybdenum cofactor biosynthesis protein [Euryarchaeota archaeon]